MKLFDIILILIIKIAICSKILTIPFKLVPKKADFSSYNSYNFLNDNYKKDLILELNIGTPFQKISSYLNQSSSCFQLKEANNTSNSIQKFFNPSKSSTFKIKEKPNILTNLYCANDIFNFNQNSTYNLNIELDEKIIKNLNKEYNSLISIIGIKPPVPFLVTCPNLFDDLKNNNAIDKKIFSIIYTNKLEGQFIIGNELNIYDKNKFNEDYYHTNYFSSDFNLRYDNIYLKFPSNKTDYINITENNNKNEAVININSGFIIGTENFRNLIHEKVFKNLITKRICELNIIRYEEGYDEFFDNNEFYLYNCYHLQFIGQVFPHNPSTNFFREFPNIVIHSKSLGINFEFTNEELFEQKYSRDYFLIIFPKINNEQNNKNTWYLGEPFYRKYFLTINIDAKTIGFYSDIINYKTKKDNINENNIKNTSKSNNIFIKILEIIIVIVFIIAAYFIGIKVKEGRKKRANELKDDNYDYISDDKKDINDFDNEKKNKQLVELNNQLGL